MTGLRPTLTTDQLTWLEEEIRRMAELPTYLVYLPVIMPLPMDTAVAGIISIMGSITWIDGRSKWKTGQFGMVVDFRNNQMQVIGEQFTLIVG